MNGDAQFCGPANVFWAAWAAVEGDVVSMIQSYKELQELE